MHNLAQRANAVFAYSLSVFFVCVGVISLYSYLFHVLDWQFDVSVSKQSISHGSFDQQRYGRHRSSGTGKQDFLFLDMQLTADLQPLFDWTVKETFVYLLLEYQSEKYSRNQVVVWDRIHMDPEHSAVSKHPYPPRYSQESLTNKYHLRDITRSLRGKQVNLTMAVEIVPHFGVLRHKVSQRSIQFTLPAEYAAKR